MLEGFVCITQKVNIAVSKLRYMNKVIQSDKNITPYGGLNFIYESLSRSGLSTFLDKELGFRSALAQYSRSDVVLSLLGNCLCQGEYIADLATLKKKFSGQSFTKIPSADTVEYVCQELKTATIHVNSEHDEKITHQINYNTALNKSLVALCVQTKQLESTVTDYTMDFDNVVVATEKQDAKMSYKMVKGYHPNFAFIGTLPIHIENHNGNTPAKYGQAETLKRCFDNLDHHQIKIEHFRADSASYQKEVIELVSQRATHFYVRITDFASIRQHCGQLKNWETIEVNYEKREVSSTLYAPFGGKKNYRIVVTRVKKKTNQIDFESASAYDYYGIMTSNDHLSNQKIIAFYNQRGDSENSNRYLLNDFNLNHLPFPDMDTNTVYMYLMAMCSILFDWVKFILVLNQTENISLTMRIKAVCFHYVTVATNFVNHARQKIIQVFSSQKYQILKI